MGKETFYSMQHSTFFPINAHTTLMQSQDTYWKSLSQLVSLDPLLPTPMVASIPLASGLPIQLPPGYKFNPTDQDIVRYLRRRSVSQALPSTVIIDKDILEHSPWHLVSGCPFLY